MRFWEKAVKNTYSKFELAIEYEFIIWSDLIMRLLYTASKSSIKRKFHGTYEFNLFIYCTYYVHIIRVNLNWDSKQVGKMAITWAQNQYTTKKTNVPHKR